MVAGPLLCRYVHIHSVMVGRFSVIGCSTPHQRYGKFEIKLFLKMLINFFVEMHLMKVFILHGLMKLYFLFWRFF